MEQEVENAASDCFIFNFGRVFSLHLVEPICLFTVCRFISSLERYKKHNDQRVKLLPSEILFVGSLTLVDNGTRDKQTSTCLQVET